MRTNNLDDRPFTQLLGELRVISNDMRKMDHEKIINWVDTSPMRDGSSAQSLVMVLPTAGCKYAMAKHGGCSMCTLPMDNPLKPKAETIAQFPQKAWDLFEERGGVKEFRGVKFYTSGSFLDRWEIPIDVRDAILAKFVEHVDEITIETRCEFVIKKNIEGLLKIVPREKLIVAIGQETTDDEINRRSINKGHTNKQFERAVRILKEYGIQTKGYILLKPLFLSELASLDDAIRSGKDMIDLDVENISINPSYIGKATLMDKMFKEGTYQPPWLWSVLISTISIKTMASNNVRVICDPVAAGSERGPSNCGNCDAEIKSALKEFSATQIIDPLYEISCECKSIYESQIQSEALYNGMGNFQIFRK